MFWSRGNVAMCAEERQSTLIVRADANARMGTGHLMRCLALAQGWQAQGGEAIFITACDSDGLLQRLSDEGFQTVVLECAYPDPDDWKATAQVLAAHPEAWVVLDGYHFDPAYQRRVKETGHRLLVIDDMAHLEHYYADVVLNQNIHAEELQYACAPYTRLLLGTEYVLLRREFWPWRGWQREIPEIARKVLVTLGGSDPDNATLKVIQALQEVPIEGLEAVVVVGGSNPHFETLQSAICHSRFTIRLESNVTNMPELMAWADIAIAAGGSTCWELAFMGLPTITLVLAANQKLAARALAEQGVSVCLGEGTNATLQGIQRAVSQLTKDHDTRQIMAQKGQCLVDGTGVVKVVKCL
jgi:UDP-2,4-diacetamido-2,4,6-trideoxy-beta-L-altropyranose hydrolase